MTQMRWLAAVLVVSLVLGVCAPASAAPPPPPVPPDVAFTLLTPLPTDLAVGEEYTVDVLVEADQPFVMCISLVDVYYPAYIQNFGDVARGGTSAVLHVKLIGRRSTAGLPGGATWFAVAAGARYGGGYVATHLFEGMLAVH
jgi:hypothetical protein